MKHLLENTKSNLLPDLYMIALPFDKTELLKNINELLSFICTSDSPKRFIAPPSKPVLLVNFTFDPAANSMNQMLDDEHNAEVLQEGP